MKDFLSAQKKRGNKLTQAANLESRCTEMTVIDDSWPWLRSGVYDGLNHLVSGPQTGFFVILTNKLLFATIDLSLGY